MYPWMYRQISMEASDSEENLKMCYKERLFFYDF